VTALEIRLPTSATGALQSGRGRPLQFRVNDLEQLFAGAESWLQLTPGALECTGTRAYLAAARVTELYLNCGMQISSRVERGRLAIVLIRAARDGYVLAGGKKYDDVCCLVVSGDELAVNVLGAASMVWFEIDGRALGRHRGGFAPVRYAFDPSALERWTLTTFAADAIQGTASEGELERLARMLLQRARSRAQSSSDLNRAMLVRTALELMWSSIEEPPTLRDICAAARCSVRTLIYVFNATFGMSPMRYFKIQRLNVAHRRLQGAGSGARIFDIAADCGFWHLGHFGVDYKAFFGTTPRMTPRRSIIEYVRIAGTP
jgi:AraC-like DNA-binding protein